MDRRTFLGTAGLGAVTGVAGCLGGEEDVEGVLLPRVELGNATSEAVTVDVIVEYDGEIEYWDAHQVAPGGGENGMGSQLVDPELPEEPGQVIAQARIDQQRASIDFAESGYGDGNCVIATFLYGFRGDDVLSAHPATVEDDWANADAIGCPGDETE